MNFVLIVLIRFIVSVKMLEEAKIYDYTVKEIGSYSARYPLGLELRGLTFTCVPLKKAFPISQTNYNFDFGVVMMDAELYDPGHSNPIYIMNNPYFLLACYRDDEYTEIDKNGVITIRIRKELSIPQNEELPEKLSINFVHATLVTLNEGIIKFHNNSNVWLNLNGSALLTVGRLKQENVDPVKTPGLSLKP